MLTKSDRVKTALDVCYTCYASRDRNIRTFSERIDAMWHEVDHHVRLMEQAERKNDAQAVKACMERIIYFVTRIEAEAHPKRG